MKAVLISIKPKWCELIASGKKTVEVRKTRPKIDTPFKVYIYETQGRTETPLVDEDGHEIFKGRGQVIGEFVCDRIGWHGKTNVFSAHAEILEKLACLSPDELFEYIKDNDFYTWHISDLKIYDKPRELSEFYHVKKIRGYHKKDEMKTDGINVERLLNSERIEVRMLSRPQQSWCYVEEIP